MPIYDIKVPQIHHVAVFTVVTEYGPRLLSRKFTPLAGEVRGDFRERCEESIADEFKDLTLARTMLLIPGADFHDIIECIVDHKQPKKA